MSSKSGFVRVSPPEAEAALTIPGVPRSRTGVLYGVFAGVALVLVLALIWWLKARGASDASAAASTATPSAATLSDPRHDAVTRPTSMPSPTLPKLFHKPAPEPEPAPAVAPAPPVVSAKASLPPPVSSATPKPASATPKPAVKKAFTPHPPADNGASVDPLPAQTSVYPELKAPELPPSE